MLEIVEGYECRHRDIRLFLLPLIIHFNIVCELPRVALPVGINAEIRYHQVPLNIGFRVFRNNNIIAFYTTNLMVELNYHKGKFNKATYFLARCFDNGCKMKGNIICFTEKILQSHA